MFSQILKVEEINVLLVFSIKTFQEQKKYVPWLSDTTKNMIKQRNEDQKAAAESNDLDDWRHYKNLRNTVQS